MVSTDKLKLLIGQAKECPTLKIVICIIDSISDDMAAMAKEANIKLMTFDEVMVRKMVSLIVYRLIIRLFAITERHIVCVFPVLCNLCFFMW